MLYKTTPLMLAVAGMSLPLAAVQADEVSINLNTWTQEGPTNAGNWTVAADGQSVFQTINGEPTFFISPDTFANTVIEGRFAVETTSDDDYIGFVFGYQSPLSANGDDPSDYEFLLLDWKQNSQTFGGEFASEGFTLSRVNGVVPPAEVIDTFWAHKDTPQLEVLATSHEAGSGWDDNVEYSFRLEFLSDKIKVDIDGNTIFDVDGDFTGGRFGFYNYSQANVRYMGFTRQDIPDDVLPPDGTPNPIPLPPAVLVAPIGLLIAGFARRRMRRKEQFDA